MEITAVALIIAILAGATALALLFYYTWKRREEGAHADVLSGLLREGVIGQPPVLALPEFSQQLVSALALEELWYLEHSGGILDLQALYPKSQARNFTLSLPVSNKLKQLLCAEYAPSPVEALAPYISADIGDRLKSRQMQWFLPVFSADTLHGLFLFSGHSQSLTEPGKRIASLVSQLLAQVYEVWQTTHLNNKHGQTAEIAPIQADVFSPSLSPTMFKLALRRGPESVVPVLIDTLKRELNVDRLSLLFDQEHKSGAWYRLSDSGEPMSIPSENAPLERILNVLSETLGGAITELSARDAELSSWVNDMQARGYSWVVPFSISARQRGILVASATKSAENAAGQLTRAATEASHIVEVAEYSRQLHEMSYTDALTGLANHRYFCRRLDEEISRAQRYSRNLSLIMFDVDELKHVNDVHGHLAGDELLRQLAARVRSSMRGIDLLARYGGDEFCIIMPETDGQMCVRFMERLQSDVGHMMLKIEDVAEPFSASISQGAAIFPEAGSDSRTLLHHADMAMIKAKNSGRNSYLLFSE